MEISAERALLRDLAKQYLDCCHDDVQRERRDLWRRHNSLQPTRPLIYVRAFAWGEMPHSQCLCQDPMARQLEGFFRNRLFVATLDDDTIFEPWVTIGAARHCPLEGLWGVRQSWIVGDNPRGAKKIDPPLKEPEDIAQLVAPRHEVYEAATQENEARARDLVGDLLPVVVDRSPLYRTWHGDLSTDLGYLRGIEPAMLDMMDRPGWLHQLMSFLRDGVLRTHEQAEAAGHWTLANHENQAMPYAEELADPSPVKAPVKRHQLWYFAASQELTGVGPALWNEFMWQYQMPIMAQFGLVAYGCCEDLTRKIDLLRQLPNLRRIAVSPMANVAKCAEQIGTDYVLSYRPSPADMVSYGFDPDRIRTILRRDLDTCRGTHVDITLKDVETVQGDPDRVRKWVVLTRQVMTDLGLA